MRQPLDRRAIWRRRRPLGLSRAAAALTTALSLTPPDLAAAPNAQSEHYVDEARRFLEQGETNAAVIQLKNAIKADPENVAARFELARLYLLGGDGASAEKELKAAVAGGYEVAATVLPLAQAYLLQRKWEPLIADCDPESVEGDARARLHVARAEAFLNLRDSASAETEALAAIGLADQIPDTHFVYALVLQERKRYDEAHRHVDRALALAPEETRFLYLKGELLRLGADLDGAVTYFGKAIDKDPKNIRFRFGRALSLIGLNRDEDADLDVEAMFETDAANALAKYLRSLILYRGKEYRDALDLLRGARGIESFAPSLYLLGTLYFLDGQTAIAEDYLKRYLIADPENIAAKTVMATIMAQRGAYDDAARLLEPIEAADADNYAVVSLLANVYLAQGRYSEAAALFDRALVLNPDNQQILFRLVQSRFVSGDPEKAIQSLETAAKDSPGDNTILALLVLGYVNAGDLAKARDAANRFRDNIPDSGLPYSLMAAIHLVERNEAAARADLEAAIAVQSDFYPAYLNLARLDRQAGRLDAAVERYEDVLDKSAGNLDALMGLAEIRRDQGDLDAAMAMAKAAGESNPEDVRPLALEIELLSMQGQTAQALAEARAALEAFPNNAAALNALAGAQLRSGDRSGAASTYRSLTALVPNSAPAQQKLASVEAELGNLAEAAAAMDRAIKLTPQSTPYRLQRLLIEKDMNGIDAASAQAETMRGEIENELHATLLVADFLYNVGDLAAALPLYEEAWKRERNRGIFLQLYRTRSGAGRTEDAVGLLEEWLKENPGDVEARFLLSQARLKQGDLAETRAQLERALADDPDNPFVLNNLAWLHEQQGDRATALELAERAAALRSDVPEIADTLGWLLLAEGRHERALALLTMANEKRPDNAEIGYHLAVALKLAGRPKEALALLEKVVTSEQAFSERDKAQSLYQSLSN